MQYQLDVRRYYENPGDMYIQQMFVSSRYKAVARMCINVQLIHRLWIRSLGTSKIYSIINRYSIGVGIRLHFMKGYFVLLVIGFRGANLIQIVVSSCKRSNDQLSTVLVASILCVKIAFIIIICLLRYFDKKKRLRLCAKALSHKVSDGIF